MAPVVAGQLGNVGIERGQVGPGTEGLVAGAGQDHHAHLELVPTPTKGTPKVGDHGRRQRVALLRAVEGYDGD